MTRRLDETVADAVARGLLPEGAQASAGAAGQRPWPVVLLTGLGAWLAAVPLIGVAVLLLGPKLLAGGGPYFVGVLCLIGSVVILRAAGVPLFVEQLAVPALLVGLGTLAFGLVRDLRWRGATAVLAVIVLAIALLVSAAWLRALLGAATALLAGFALMPGAAGLGLSFGVRQWAGWHFVLAIWVVAQEVLRIGVRGRMAAAIEPIGNGWAVAGVVALAWSSGQTLLLGAVHGTMGAGALGAIGSAAWPANAARAASVLLALAAALWVGRRWRGARRPVLVAVAVVLASLGWFVPALGAALLVLALAATQRRRTLAAVAALAALWSVGALYYSLDWPLATKALVLLAAGALLGVLAVVSLRGERGGGGAAAGGLKAGAAAPGAAAPSATARRAAVWAIALSAGAVPAVAGFAVWQKERLIAEGEPLFVELAPVDPRSLIQGDYMRLEFAMPAALRQQLDRTVTSRRPRVVARRDEHGVATIDRLAGEGPPPAAGERLIELTPKGGRWIVVTDAWFFREGEAARWRAAKFGEFRVEPDGRALLVGLRGEGLKPL